MQKIKNFLVKTLTFLGRNWLNPQNRPNIVVKLPFLFRALDALNLFVIMALWIYTFYIFPNLPEEIPVHFTWDGSADDWRSKYFIFLAISILVLIFAFLSYISKYYIHYNYPVEITLENAEYQYLLALKFFLIMKTLNVILFTYIHYVMVVGAFDKSKAYFDCQFWIVISMVCSSTFIYKKIAQKSSNINSRLKTE
jgi:uncharacterized membrane protein